MGSTIRTSGTTYYSIWYSNSEQGFNGLKYVYSVISVIDKRLPGNTKKWTIAPFVDGQISISRILGGNSEFFALSSRWVLRVCVSRVETHLYIPCSLGPRTPDIHELQTWDVSVSLFWWGVWVSLYSDEVCECLSILMRCVSVSLFSKNSEFFECVCWE